LRRNILQIQFQKSVITPYLPKLISDKAEVKVVPILENFLLSVTTNEVIIYSTSLHLFSIIKLPISEIEVKEEGSVLISIEKFLTFIKYANETDNIEIYTTAKTVIVKYQNAKLEVLGQSLEDYPEIYSTKSEVAHTFTIQTSELDTINDYLKPILYDKNDKPEMKTYGISGYQSKLNFISTDMIRLANYVTKINSNGIVPYTINPLIVSKLFVGYQSNAVTITNYKDNILRIDQDNITFYARTLENKFPQNIENLVPKQFESEITVNRIEFIKSLRQISAIEDLVDTRVMISIKDSNITLTTRRDENQAQSYLPFLQTITDIEVYINLKLLLEILATMKCEKIILQLNKQLPCIIKEESVSNVFFLIMPLKA